MLRARPFLMMLVLLWSLTGCQVFEAPTGVMPLKPQVLLKNTVIDFYLTSCFACQQIAPKLDAVVKSSPQITLLKINVQDPSPEEKKWIQIFKVNTVPHVIFLDAHGVVKAEFKEDASTEALQQAVFSVLNSGQLEARKHG
jgi:thiol-disulfide isomerase/thioredoxin